MGGAWEQNRMEFNWITELLLKLFGRMGWSLELRPNESSIYYLIRILPILCTVLYICLVDNFEVTYIIIIVSGLFDILILLTYLLFYY